MGLISGEGTQNFMIIVKLKNMINNIRFNLFFLIF